MDDILKKLLAQMQAGDVLLQAKMNDQRLELVAEYDVTKGYMNYTATREDMQKRFCEYKNIIKKGESTLKQLEDDVYSRWGIIEPERSQQINDNDTHIIGFNIDDLPVAKMKDKDKRNH